MGGVYRVVRSDGSVEYTDTPSGAGRIESLRPGTARPNEREAERRYDPKLAAELIKEAQKRVPKVVDYLDYIDYLRHNSPIRFDRVMNELRQQDPQTWLKLQKYPQFRPLRETAIGIKAGDRLLAGGIGLASGNALGSAEKWMETTLKELMKRDRFGPYADVLGSKATTLAVPEVRYSNSRLGQYLKGEDVRAAAAAKATAKDLETARAGLRAAKGAAVTRAMGPMVDLGIGMLDPQKANEVGTIALRLRAQKLFERGVLDEEQWAESQQLLSTGRYVEMQQLMDKALGAYVSGR
jgi:hypothetical protein